MNSRKLKNVGGLKAAAATRMQRRIYNVLKAAMDDSNSEIFVTTAKKSKTNRGTLEVYNGYGAVHAIRFKLSWKTDHYIGKFVDAERKLSHAVISLYNPFDAAQFVVAMNLLVDLRARVHNAVAS